MIESIQTADDNGARLRAHLPDEAATVTFGAALARVLAPGLQIWLQGNLGTGKTTLTRGLLRGLGHEGKVKSPTYTLIEPYSADEYLDAGLDEYFAGEGVCIVEWPDKASPHLPSPDVEIVLQTGESGRDVAISGNTEAGRTCVIGLVKALRGADPAPGTT